MHIYIYTYIVIYEGHATLSYSATHTAAITSNPPAHTRTRIGGFLSRVLAPQQEHACKLTRVSWRRTLAAKPYYLI